MLTIKSQELSLTFKSIFLCANTTHPVKQDIEDIKNAKEAVPSKIEYGKRGLYILKRGVKSIFLLYLGDRHEYNRH